MTQTTALRGSIMNHIPVIDGHADIWISVDEKRKAGETQVFKKHHLDGFQQGNIAHCVFAVWLDNNCSQDDVTSMMTHRLEELQENQDILHQILNFSDFKVAENSSKLGVLTTLEGLHYLKGNIDLLDTFYAMGVRQASLTWNEANHFGTGATGNPDDGLTALGLNALHKIQGLNMMFDVSHLNEKSFWDVMDHTSKPIIATHSNAKSLCDHCRNLTDEQLVALSKTGGFIGLNAVPSFVSTNDAGATMDRLVDHFVHIASLVGIDHIGFGFDFLDYLDDFSNSHKFIPNIQSCRDIPNLLKALETRGFTHTDIEKIAYKNFLSFAEKIL